ncbi:small GTP-binding protein [Alkaliphilus metalliredigens QYMF]|uniref:Small GTP-binding protein n=1 Tax=Alkaliphilus metalliredigens (strain QYMF) TaxID=293826 RepID=A6TLU9_ALKMQ|nr:ferrous iron transporter B [Alkaliphilus metalliredigens]ABR47167.1 small GTP-binding protein [Alkaliphilus metalliredigens QYMF]
MGCHEVEEKIQRGSEDGLRVLLMGNPNVGKSVIFSKLTGKEVLAANYTGTTVSFTKGNIHFGNKKGTLIDVPGTYSLKATSPAEEVAVDLMKEGADVIIFVLDATNLERNLSLALQVKQYGIPTVFALNLGDVAEHKGITIDTQKLEAELNAPVIPTIATRNIGLKNVLEKAWEVALHNLSDDNEYCLQHEDTWEEATRITKAVESYEYKEPTLWDRIEDLTLKPFPGIPIAMLVLVLSLGFVVGGGKAIRATIFLPLLNNFYAPFMMNLVSNFVQEGMAFNILVGDYGVLIKAIEWPFALILPYVTLFYIVLSFLEDSGYLPRLGALADGALRRVGIQGGNIIPFIMGYGCAVPAILGTRSATSFKERLTVSMLVSLAVPCVAQSGAFFALLGDQSIVVLIATYLVSFAAIVIGGMILNRVIPGKIDPILLEMPNLLMPNIGALRKKIWIRIRDFMIEAEVPMILGIAFAAFIAETGVLNAVNHFVEPLVVGWLGLPAEASLGLMLGVVRRELAVLPLLELDLTTAQLFVGSVVALFYLPCLSVLAVLIKEFRLKIALGIAGATIFIAFFVGGLINHFIKFFGIVL